jgi:hypothetical protein
LLLLATSANAAPVHLAIVYGHNGGTALHAPLRFAEADAARVAATLTEVAGVKPEDLKLLQGKPREDLDAAIQWATARVAAIHKTPGSQAILTVYLSSHGDDGRGLELGPQTLPWAELKASIAATKADVRVAFVDACNASGLLDVSGKRAGAFEIKAEDRLTVSGEAWVTSSAANEPSLEAGAYKGSVFTHHLIAALRGAADRSADGLISLEEAYRYAYARTVEGESGQHPGYGFKLAGYGELVVSTPKTAASTLALPKGLEAITVADAATQDRFLEVRLPEGRLLALPAGRWQLEVWRSGKARAGRLTLAAGDHVTLDEATLNDPSAATAQLVRLSGGPAACAKKLEGEPGLVDRLTAVLGKPRPDCAVSLQITRERAHGLHLTGTFGARPLDLRTDDGALEADLRGALAQ